MRNVCGYLGSDTHRLAVEGLEPTERADDMVAVTTGRRGAVAVEVKLAELGEYGGVWCGGQANLVSYT